MYSRAGDTAQGCLASMDEVLQLNPSTAETNKNVLIIHQTKSFCSHQQPWKINLWNLYSSFSVNLVHTELKQSLLGYHYWTHKFFSSHPLWKSHELSGLERWPLASCSGGWHPASSLLRGSSLLSDWKSQLQPEIIREPDIKGNSPLSVSNSWD